MKNPDIRTIFLKDYKAPAFLIKRTDLYFNLHEIGTEVSSRLEIERNPEALPDQQLTLDGENLELLEFKLNGQAQRKDQYQLTATSLSFQAPVDPFVVETRVRIAPEKNTALEGLYRSGAMFCTQCEAQGFRKITWYLDRPDVMAVFTTTIEADAKRYPVLLSNGNASNAEPLGQSRHRITWSDPFPKPSYLFALVAGDLALMRDRFTTLSGREIDLRIYTEPEYLDSVDYAMQSLKRAMRWDEEQYGREYDLDIFMIVAVNDFNMGAMENKGLNLFNAKLLVARPETATDVDYQHIEAVVAHEYFHNWTGNRITCRDWFQLSLKEGLTVYRDQEFSADMGSASVKRIQDVRLLRSHQFAEDESPMAHPVRPDAYIEINNFYTLTVYEKGAELIRMQAAMLGREVFRRAMDLYFNRHDGQAVTIDDFVKSMADASGKDLDQFKRWYSQAGTPLVKVSGQYDAKARQYILDVTQELTQTSETKQKQPQQIPFVMAMLNKKGEQMPMLLEAETESPAERVLDINQWQQRFVFHQVDEKPVLSLARGFSAPIKLEYDYSDDELLFLLLHDKDGFCRWDAALQLHQRFILSAVEKPDFEIPHSYFTALSQLITKSEDDKELIAEMLHLPSESYLADQMHTPDIEGIFKARRAHKQAIAKHLATDLLKCYQQNNTGEAYLPEQGQIAMRALKNCCLDYISHQVNDQSNALLARQYFTQHSMTDVLAAMSSAVITQNPCSDDLLIDFEQRWSTHLLVMDKWLSVQARVGAPDTLNRVKALMIHRIFEIANPNRVRALIGSFVTGNPFCFHMKDGSGYRFLADQVIEIDRINPQIAARLLRNLSRWKRYDEKRQQLMRSQLERLSVIEGLSKDTQEILKRSLS